MVCMPPFIGLRRLCGQLRLVSPVMSWCAIALALSLVCDLRAVAPKKTSTLDVEAADLLNFGRFMRHPDPQLHHSTFDICILGRDTLGREIDDIASKETINHLPVRVPRISDPSSVKDCEIVFISIDEGERVRRDIAILSQTTVLTVSDAPDFLQQGGMIQFLVVASQVRFAVNLTALNQSHLALSSEILKLAVTVMGESPREERP